VATIVIVEETQEPSFVPRLRDAVRRGFSINPLLMSVGLVMLATLFATMVGLMLDNRVITGQPAWLKPAKFAISISIYIFTFLWLLTFVKGRKGLVNFAAWVTAIGFVVEMAIIGAQVVRGTESHFNFRTDLDAILFAVMGMTIVAVWIMGLLLAVMLMVQRIEDRPFAWSLRIGVVLALVGMAVAFLMTSPTSPQLAALKLGAEETLMGAHSVGVADGGPGLPIVGWSTEGGDLRIAHFIGIHAMQVLPFIGWFISRRLRNVSTGSKVSLVLTAGLSYGGLIGILTWQALRGQSIVSPDALTLQAFAALITAVALSVIATFALERRRVVSSR
jgi:hypothetical protein